MKTKYLINLSIAFMVVFLLAGCKKWIDTEINKDPGKPTDVPMELLLPTSEVNLGFQSGSDIMRPACQWMQQISGISRQSLTFERYKLTESDMNNVWYYGMYSNAMMNLKVIMDKAVEENAPNYGGVAKVLMAYSLGIMTDLFGDIPYSEAFQGSENLTPKFDSQSDIYNTIFSLLSSAIDDLRDTTGAFSPGGDDVIYNGDLDLWIEAAYSLTARYKIHLSKVNSSSAYADALTALAYGFSSNASNLQVNFEPGNANPLAQFEQDRTDVVVGGYLVDEMTTMGDPRLPVYAQQNGAGEYVGSPAGNAAADPSHFGTYFISDASPVVFMSYAELKFIEAEAKFQTNDKAGAATAHNEAVLASLAEFGVSDGSFEATYASETATTITIEKIMKQKYIALYLNVETFTDWRRYDNLLGLTPAVGNTNNNIIPRRYPYATSERNYNSNCPGATVNDRVWWDQ